MRGFGVESAEASLFSRRLVPLGRILEDPHYHIWCCSPIYDEEGRVHVFFSRWPLDAGHDGWLRVSEIAHAVSDEPGGPYEVLGTVLSGSKGEAWDAATIHNPTVQKIGSKYAMFYLGNSDGTVQTQRIGLALADSLYGPWNRVGNGPLLDVSENKGMWDSYITANPALLQHQDGQFWLYYKAWDRYNDNMRKMGVAIAKQIEGPYIKHPANPLVDFSCIPAEAEDAYVFEENGKYHMLMRDMGGFSKRGGIYLESEDGVQWSQPSIGYYPSHYYFDEPEYRFERPQVLMRNGAPAYLFLALMGWNGHRSSGAVLQIQK
jgi:hypothetical protein